MRVECSLAFHDDGFRKIFDPTAPTVENRITAIRFLRKEKIPVVLRIDPLFPRDPLPSGKTMSDFDLPDIQPIYDLDKLVRFAREVGVDHLVYSIVKITRPRDGSLPPIMEKMKQVYEYLSPDQSLVFRGGSWRLPVDVGTQLVAKPFLAVCRQNAIEAKSCKANLVSTP